MNKIISLFPLLNEESLKKIGYLKTQMTAEFFKEMKHSIELEKSNFHTYILVDETGEWGPDDCSLTLKQEVFIRNPNYIFHPLGIVPKTAKVGVSLNWSCRRSGLRGVFKSGGFYQTHMPIELDLCAYFKPGLLKGEVVLETVLFLEEPGKPDENEKFLINESGSIIGILDKSVIIIDGNGSIFPISELSDPEGPLWTLETSWTDVRFDNFQESVKIYINTVHKDYQLLMTNNDIQRISPMMREILATVLTLIIDKAFSDPEFKNQIISNEGLSQDSVGSVINYFYSTFGWQSDNIEQLSIDIRKTLDNNLG